MYTAVTDHFPNISTVRVKDAIAQVTRCCSSLADGVRAASLRHHSGGPAGAGRRHRGGQPRAAL